MGFVSSLVRLPVSVHALAMDVAKK